ncbi:hypothetical protein ELH81_15765 [Rhizobium leguminosarum]|uniref:hypothetical protein n=1 Tax=Rhizobium leguminosarum TaxID=384 RepID=UPI001030F6D1|nr:hypothetical protein [Rhizobium leguminosarum]TAZ15428.1 hypothetical protein ELH81_15765 [Rhizobium leguminosarum]
MTEFDSLAARWRWSTAANTIERLRCLADDLEAVAEGRVPDRPDTLMTTWAFATRQAPCIIGNSFGHPKIDEGRRAFISEVYYVDPDRRLARTLSRWYRLGSHNPLEAIPGISSIRDH